MQPGFRAGATLGDIIFGKPDGSVYGEQMERNMRTAKLMEEARHARSRNLAAQEQTPEAVSAAYGVPIEMARLLSAGMRTQESANYNVLGATPLDMQELSMRKAAVEAGVPVLGTMNANLAGIDGKPVEMNKVEGGYQVSPYVQGAAPVPLGGELADIDLTRAKINTERAQAGLYDTQASVGGYNPNTGTRGRAVNFTMPAQGTLNMALGTTLEDGTRVGDPAQQETFRIWAAEQAAVDPTYADGEYALSQWLAKKSAVTPYTTASGKQTVIPAGYTPEMIEGFGAFIADRRARGLPDLSKVQKRQVLMNAKRTGSVSLSDSDPNSVVWHDGSGSTRIPLGSKAPAPKAGGLRVGEIRKGYRYTGGPAGDRKSWVKI